jgi:ATP-dependent helicase HrpA
MLATGEQVKYLRKTIGRDTAFVLAARDLAPDADLATRVISLAYDRVFLDTEALPRDRAAFEARLAAGRGALVGYAQDLASRIAEVAERRRELRLRLAKRVGGEEGRRAAADMQDQLSALFPSTFPLGIPAEWLAEYPRYLKAMDLRLERLAGGKSEAREREALSERWARVRGQLERDWPSAESRDRFEQVRWLTEEFRVSLFAQSLGTRVKVSAVRLDRAWEELEAAVRAVG